ncbi:MAG: replicative DNA helicase [Corynebacterium sp.]|nr:replicative DNA helicase [Corynebacterium sp.]
MESAASFDDDYVPPEPAPAAYDRQLPHNIEAEQGVLGAMLVSSHVIPDVIEILRTSDFYRPAHQVIYTAILELFSTSSTVDAVLVANHLSSHKQLQEAGGTTYLHTLVASVPTAANARYYADIVAHKALFRKLIEAGTKVVSLGYESESGIDAEQAVDLAQQEVFAVKSGRRTEDYAVLGDLLQPAVRELDELAANKGKIMGASTGFYDLDAMTTGLHGGQMIIVAARPGVGKSTLALDFARATSIKNKKVSLIFSLEMSKSEIVMRILSAQAEVKLATMRAGKLDDKMWNRLSNTMGTIENAPLYIDDSPGLTMMEIRTKARRLADQVGLDLVVVDYLQLMSSNKRVESRQQEVSEFSRQLKLLAKELDVPVVAISQLNRGPESRTDKRPQLADLRESGALEQDADIVMLLYRPDSQAGEQDNERAGEADIIIAKHRGGPLGTVTVAHQLHYSRFVDIARTGAGAGSL